MKKKYKIITLASCFYLSLLATKDKEPTCNNEFIVVKKTKKENASDLKEEIAYQLEELLRQTSRTMHQSIELQNKIFDTIKELVTANPTRNGKPSVFTGSTTELKLYKEMLDLLEKELKNLSQQLLKCQLNL